MKTHLNVPSDFPISTSQAYKIAVARWGVNDEENRQDACGIMHSVGGANGTEKRIDWADLPAPTHRCGRKTPA